MKFGVATFFTGQGIGPAALAQALEERGFDSLFVTEHTHIPASRRTPYPAGGELPERYYRLFDPFLALTAAATVTRTLLRHGINSAHIASWPAEVQGCSRTPC